MPKIPEHPSQNWLPFPLLPVHTDQVEVKRYIFFIYSLFYDDIHLGIITVKKKKKKKKVVKDR